MSRIHDALKRSQQDRAAHPTLALSLGDTPESSTSPTAAPEIEPGAAAVIAASPLGSTPLMAEMQVAEEMRTRCRQLYWKGKSKENVFTNPKLGHAAEQFRTLRSRLYQTRDEQPLRKLLITSALPAEGKTFVSYNLAQALVRQADRRVLIIDGDLRHPQMHFLLGAPTTPGLSDYLEGRADELAIIQKGQQENLFFIPGGKQLANPSELLMNGRLKVLFDHLSSAFDWVILDSPPCLPVADANVLAQQCDGVLLVVLGASTPAATAQKALKELQGRNVLGVVLNALEHESPSYYGPYHGSVAQAEAVPAEER
jgi:protein-tyrosine kinase